MQSYRHDNRNALLTAAAARRCWRWALAALVACAPLIHMPSAQSHESEQYTLPAGRAFADLGPYFSKIAYDAVVAATAETNTAIEQAIAAKPSSSQLEELQSADFIAGKVWGQFFLAIPTNELLDATLASASVQSQYPGLVTMYRPPISIYDDPLLVIDLTKFVRTFFRAGSVSAGGYVVGTDKIIHFINIGRIYHTKYEARLKRGLPEKEAIKSAIASTSRNPLTSEDGVLGMWTTGIHSNGDLAADYAGMMFYRNLTEAVHLGPRTMPPMLVRDGPYWRVQVQPDSDFFVAFITPHWNEVLNPNKFAGYTAGRMRTLIRERCALAQEWYRDPRGEPRRRAQFEAIEQELATYYGADYGHERNPAHPVSIAEVCFPKGSGATSATLDGNAKATPNPGVVSTPASGPDALGRTPLWWAARDGNLEQVRSLAAAGTDINAADLDGETPLHAATRAASAVTVQELVSRGADPNRAALYGVTPLLLAATGSKMDIAAELLQAGASPNARNVFGRTALHDAALRGNSQLTMALLERGADPRIADDGGNTPLHLAARRGDEKVAKLLLARGADARALNDLGATPRDEALRQGHTTMAEQLSSAAHAGSAGARSARAATDGTLAYRNSEQPEATAPAPAPRTPADGAGLSTKPE